MDDDDDAAAAALRLLLKADDSPVRNCEDNKSAKRKNKAKKPATVESVQKSTRHPAASTESVLPALCPFSQVNTRDIAHICTHIVERKVANTSGKARRQTHRQPQDVEGIFNSEGELHLLDAATNVVYSSVRNRFGDLVPVGVYDKEQKEIVLQEVEPDVAERQSAESPVRSCLS